MKMTKTDAVRKTKKHLDTLDERALKGVTGGAATDPPPAPMPVASPDGPKGPDDGPKG